MTNKEFKKLNTDREIKEIKVIYQNGPMLLIGAGSVGGWALATQVQYDNLDVSFAHLDLDGKLFRFGSEIGSYKDLELTK